MRFLSVRVLLAVAAASALVAVPIITETASQSSAPALATRAGSVAAADKETVKRLSNRLVDEFKARYQVAHGYTKVITVSDCKKYTVPKLGTCLGNNAAAPYIVAAVPTWPGEYVDPVMRNLFFKTGRGLSVTHRFDRREAILLFGVMPPPARYTGIQTYLWTHNGTFDTSSNVYQFIATKYPNFLDFLFTRIPHEPGRILSFSSLSNPINNVVMKRQSGSPWGTLKAFVITPDKTMNRVVRNTLARVGISSKNVFTEPIPSDGFKLGLKKADDDFMTLVRYAMPDNEAAGKAWRNALPLAVLRVRERRSSNRLPKPYPEPVLDAHSAHAEAAYDADLGALSRAVCERWKACSTPVPFIDAESNPINLVGPDCRRVGMNCLGDNQDTSYMMTPALPLDQGEIYAVTGTLGTETDNATYVGLSVNNSSDFSGVANLSDTQLKGSADSYTTVHNTSKLFVYYLSRDCKGLESLTHRRCLSITTRMVESGGNFKLAMREYIHPGTERGPDSTKLLKPLVFKVTSP